MASEQQKPSLLCWPNLTVVDEASRHFSLTTYSDFFADSRPRPDVVAALVSPYHNFLDEAALARLPNLRVVANHGVGVDHIDAKLFADRGVVVTNTPGVAGEATAETALMLMLNVARRQRAMQAAVANGAGPLAVPLGVDICSSVVGIVGLGSIGRGVARRCRLGFGARVQYHQRRRAPRQVEEELGGLEYRDSLRQLAADADFLVLACPLTPDTELCVNEDLLLAMKPSSIVVNVARGRVVDTDALVRALADGRLAGAGLDVSDPEPLPPDHPLLAPGVNAWVTPHCGTHTIHTRVAMQRSCLASVLNALADAPADSLTP